MDNKSTTKRMIGAVVLVLVAALLLAWLLKGKTRKTEEEVIATNGTEAVQQDVQPISGFPGLEDTSTQQEQVVVADAVEEDLPPPSILETAQETDAASIEQQQLAAEEAEEQNIADAGQISTDNTETQQAADGKETFAIRPGEVRGVINPDGTVSKGIGSMGTDDAVVADAATNTSGTQAADTAASTDSKSAQVADSSTSTTPAQQGQQTATAQQNTAKPTATGTVASTKSSDSEQKTTSNRKPVIVAEKAVPEKSSTPSSTTSSSTTRTPRIVATTESRPASTDTTRGDSDKDGFVIQVLATSSRGKANGVKDSIASDGYPVFVTNAKVNGKSIYRVRIGSYSVKSEAARVQARMKARYSQNEFVQNSFVTNHQ